jgi:alpha-L-fucosidase
VSRRDCNRREFLTLSAALLALGRSRSGSIDRASERPRPSPAQLAWQRDERALFIHFGVNTFTNREWGEGTESPAVFNPARLDARQWARAARAAGFRELVLTAKHHDGFCLWPSALTDHTVAHSPWRDGKGDVVREFTDACRAEGLGAGLYLSPWDRHEPHYGDSPRYNDFYIAQLTELLTRYGPLKEVWFDGANGEGPDGRRQVYDWPRVFQTVRRLQPGAVMFSDAGPDVRWIGNEQGHAGEPNWSTMNPAAVPEPGAPGDEVIQALQHGDPAGAVWRPAEADVSIRPGWFWHPEEDGRVRSVEDLLELYFASVGRNAKLLLNVPPTTDGLLHETDVARLAELGRRVAALFAEDLAGGAHPRWREGPGATGSWESDLGRAVTVGLASLQEEIEAGQCIARYRLEGWTGAGWVLLSRGATIGYRRLDRFPPLTISRVRLTIEEAIATPKLARLGLYAGE